MVQQAQPEALLRALSSQLGVNPQELEARARQQRFTYAATMAAVQSGCTCDACKLLRETVGNVVDDALKELPPAAKPVQAVPVEG